ncbi:MAG: NADH-quinone oxidoreductase subunit N [Nitrospirae bacterium]|nr:NADH-quinone oxidoreductase subunit N [Nitrospirota bacterium]
MSLGAAFGPAWALLAAGILVLLVDLWSKNRSLQVFLAVAGVIAGIAWGISASHAGAFDWQNMLASDPLSRGAAVGFAVLTGLLLLGSHDFFKAKRAYEGEVIYLLLFGGFAMALVPLARDLVVLFIALETVSLVSYTLIAHLRAESGRVEAGIKYMLLGAFGSAVLLMGIAFYFGVTGTTSLDPARWKLGVDPTGIGWILSTVFILSGLGFKIACAPFHVYAPDVYQGAPGPISGFLAGASKAASFLALYSVGSIWFTPGADALQGSLGDREILRNVIRLLAVLTMAWGTVLGVIQTEVKRILAYSSIAHTGYILLFLLVPAQAGEGVLIFYVGVYALMKIGAFLCVSVHEARTGEKLELKDLSRLRAESPWLALAFGVFLFSLAGVPPTGGFMAKLLLFREAVAAGETPLVIVGVLTSVIAAGFYLKITIPVFLTGEDRATERPHGFSWLRLVAVVTSAAVLYLGLFPPVSWFRLS